jgi:hypothetical protein
MLYDACSTISVYDLVNAGCLALYIEAHCTISLQNVEDGPTDIRIYINTKQATPSMDLSYFSNGQQIKEKIKLVHEPFRLNDGILWYFVCPRIGIRCRKLYFSQGYFTHRKAVKGIYTGQLVSGASKDLVKQARSVSTLGEILGKLNTPCFRKSYAGKHTKTYKRIIKELKKQSPEIGAYR